MTKDEAVAQAKKRLYNADNAIDHLGKAVIELRLARCAGAADRACDALRSATAARHRIATTGGAHDE